MFEENESQSGIWRFFNVHNVGFVLFVAVGMVFVVIFDGGEDVDGTVQWSSTGGDLWEGDAGSCQDIGDGVMFKRMGDDERVHLSIYEDYVLLHGSMDFRWERSQCTMEAFQLDTGEGDGVVRGSCVAEELRVSWDVEYEYCGEEGGGV